MHAALYCKMHLNYHVAIGLENDHYGLNPLLHAYYLSSHKIAPLPPYS